MYLEDHHRSHLNVDLGAYVSNSLVETMVLIAYKMVTFERLIDKFISRSCLNTNAVHPEELNRKIVVVCFDC